MASPELLVHHHAPSPAQAECLSAFGALRKGCHDADALELGEGCNRFPPSPDLAGYLSGLLDRLIRDGTLSSYGDPRRGGTRQAMAELLGPHLGLVLEPRDVFFTRGGTEAISLTLAHLAHSGHSLTLPLPSYYAFDQCAVRWGASVTGYYRHDGQHHTTGAPPGTSSCLVEVLPNGVTGARHALPQLPAPDFTVVDVPFQTGAAGAQPADILRERVRSLDLRTSALILTASKDLSLPGLRAAVIVTKNKALLGHLSRDHFERLAMSGNPVGEIALLFYVSVLLLLDAPDDHLGKLVQIAQDCVRRAHLPALPDEEIHHRARAHLTAMGNRFRHNAEALTDPASPLRQIEGLAPAAGYSAFAELHPPQADFLRWVSDCGQRGLRLNPTVVHGGTNAAWNTLYPGKQLLRINLSEEPADFRHGLALLKQLAERPGRSPGMSTTPHGPPR
ncbi:hypothetical protein ACIO3O_34685 [Streptomyces sp. NPDC087440]|uniref:hypothetical protein n=1 Tax=Streptomyces sp. NPDC087440 TaxID=3365790 RepID=UPI0037F6E5D0